MGEQKEIKEGIKLNLTFTDADDAFVEEYEKQVAAENCKKAFRTCGIGRDMFGASLKLYDQSYEIQKSVMSKVRIFYDNVKNNRKSNMIIHGDAGEGKTLLAAGILKQFCYTKKKVVVNDHELESFYTVKYLTSFEMCTMFRNARSYSVREYSEYSFYRDFTRTFDIMVIDEVGKAEDPNEWLILFEVLDKRMQEQKWTILITNLQYEALNKKLSSYGMSRLNIDGNLILIDTTGLPDFRQKPELLYKVG